MQVWFWMVFYYHRYIPFNLFFNSGEKAQPIYFILEPPWLVYYLMHLIFIELIFVHLHLICPSFMQITGWIFISLPGISSFLVVVNCLLFFSCSRDLVVAAFCQEDSERLVYMRKQKL